MYDDFIILVAEVAIGPLAMRNSYHILATQIEAEVETSTKRGEWWGERLTTPCFVHVLLSLVNTFYVNCIIRQMIIWTAP